MKLIFECRAEGYYEPDHWDHVTAYNEWEAARMFAGACDADSALEWCDHGRCEPIVLVRLKGEEETKKFKVQVEFDPVYYVEEVK